MTLFSCTSAVPAVTTRCRLPRGKSVVMPFGKWAGYDLGEIPDDYLEWLQTRDNLKPRLRREVEYQLGLRGIPYESAYNWSPPPRSEHVLPPMEPAERQLLSRLVIAGYRALSLKLHPDAGGSTAEMQTLNLLMERLRREKLAV
jgi:uncharacterized protein (DUF3820 family)